MNPSRRTLPTLAGGETGYEYISSSNLTTRGEVKQDVLVDDDDRLFQLMYTDQEGRSDDTSTTRAAMCNRSPTMSTLPNHYFHVILPLTLPHDTQSLLQHCIPMRPPPSLHITTQRHPLRSPSEPELLWWNGRVVGE